MRCRGPIPTGRQATFLRLGSVALVLAATSSCSVQLLATEQDQVTNNQCTQNSDCGKGATCSAGMCLSSSGSIDQVFLEIVPEPTSQLVGGLSFLSSQSGIVSGKTRQEVKLGGSFFVAQVQMDPDDMPAGCPYVSNGPPPTIAATIEFSRTNSLTNIPLLGLPKAQTTVQTRQSPAGWSRSVTLAPGTYDVYVQPQSFDNCQLPPKMLRSIEVPADGPVAASAPPATVTLPKPIKLQGRVQSRKGALAEWQVDVLEPQEGRIISTAWQWPTVVSDVTNFYVSYQPVSAPAPLRRSDNQDAPLGQSPILRIRPPDRMSAVAPRVYWDLSAIDLDGDGSVSLDLSGLPTPDELVAVSGQVRDGSGAGVAATLQFSSSQLDGTMGLTASFLQSLDTRPDGSYSTTLFPGSYRVSLVPERDQLTASPAGTAPADSSLSAITQQGITVRAGPEQRVELSLATRRLVRGIALAGPGSLPALGATFTATPATLADNSGVWHGALAQTPVVPDGASTTVSGQDGSFAVSLDPGVFDLSVRAADGSGFGWWVLPRTSIEAPSSADDVLSLKPRLSYPVSLEGPLVDSKDAPLANAVVRAYAPVPDGSGVAKVGETRTDASGHYRLLLPSSFAR